MIADITIDKTRAFEAIGYLRRLRETFKKLINAEKALDNPNDLYIVCLYEIGVELEGKIMHTKEQLKL